MLPEVQLGYEPNPVPVTHNGDPMLVIGVRKEAGANVLALTGAMRETVEQLNAGVLRDNDVYIHWAYDQVPYIENAVETVRINLLIGAALAILVLLVFLRSVGVNANCCYCNSHIRSQYIYFLICI